MKATCVLVGLFVAVLWILVNVPESDAQTVTGSFRGTVSDQQGAVITGASVSAKDRGTGVERNVLSDSSGLFSIQSAPAGVYDITASASGFKTVVQSGIEMTVGANVRVDFKLNVGDTNQRIFVTAEAPQVDTISSTMSGLVDESSIRELPLNGRDWLQLATLEPGVLRAETQTTNLLSRGVGMKMSISGGRPTENVYRVDGMVVNDIGNGSPGSALGVNLGVDGISEFAVLTSTYDAEYGRSSGGVINAITKSGTNAIHGTAFEFLRNSVLDARNYFDPSTIPPFRRNQFGGSLGGPIRKDKLFFFANYEGLRQFLSESLQSTTLSPNAKNGILCADPACTTTTTVTVDPRVKPYLPLYPVPTPGTITGDTGLFIRPAGQVGSENYVLGKIDYQLGASTTLTGSYLFDKASLVSPDIFDEKLTGTRTRNQRVMLSLQHIFNQHVINTFRAGFNRVVGAEGVDTQALDPLLNDPSLSFIPGQNVGDIQLPNVDSFGGLGDTGANLYWYTAPQLTDDLAWVKGRNDIRMGFSVEAIQENENAQSTLNGTWTFGSILDFLTVVPQEFDATFPGTSTYRGIRTKIFGAYIQDDFQVRRNLMLNLGLRYEPSTVISLVNGLAANLRNLSDPQPTIGNPLYANPSLRNFAPRIGLAWDPFGDAKTAVRAGFGVFDIDPTPNLIGLKVARTVPFYRAGILVNPPSSSFPNTALNLVTPDTATTTYIHPGGHQAYKMQWNLNIQRQIFRGLSVMAGYVGSRGVHLPITIQDADQVPPSLVTVAPDGHLLFPTTGPIQRINPNFAKIPAEEWVGYSTYHALQVNVAQELRHGFALQAVYQWSKSIDIGSNEYGNADLGNSMDLPWVFMPGLNRGLSDFDIPQHLSVNLHWDAPSLHSGNAVSKFLLSGWEPNGIFTVQSGSPFSARLSSDRARTGGASGGSSTASQRQRPNFVPGPGCSTNAINPGNFSDYIKLQCFAFPALGELGDLGRNTLRGPGLEDVDFALFKNNHLGEKLNVQFRAEIFNLLNRANLSALSVTVFDSHGNLLTNNARLKAPTVTTSRQIQFGVKFIF